MPDDYLQTAKRMYDDANTLFSTNSYYNTCYLSGYVLECFMKQIILLYGENGAGNKYRIEEIAIVYRHNIGKLVSDLNMLITTLKIPAKVNIDIVNKCSTMYDGIDKWHPESRYGNKTNWHNNNVAQNYIVEINYINSKISEMAAGGLI